MQVQKLLKHCLRNLERLGENSTGGVKPEQGEIWLTRDGKHKVQLVLADPLRPDSQYPLTGVVVEPENGGDFKNKQQVLYPRFTSKGKFTTHQDMHPLDLRERLV